MEAYIKIVNESNQELIIDSLNVSIPGVLNPSDYNVKVTNVDDFYNLMIENNTYNTSSYNTSINGYSSAPRHLTYTMVIAGMFGDYSRKSKEIRDSLLNFVRYSPKFTIYAKNSKSSLIETECMAVVSDFEFNTNSLELSISFLLIGEGFERFLSGLSFNYKSVFGVLGDPKPAGLISPIFRVQNNGSAITIKGALFNNEISTDVISKTLKFKPIPTNKGAILKVDVKNKTILLLNSNGTPISSGFQYLDGALDWPEFLVSELNSENLEFKYSHNADVRLSYYSVDVY